MTTKTIQIDLRKKYPITLIWGQINNEYKVPIFYDHRLKLATPFIDYCIYLAKQKIEVKAGQQAYKSYIEPITFSINNFLEFLRFKNVNWEIVDDSLLSEFRDWSLKRTINNSRSRNRLTASRTANGKLIRIYEFYNWAQNVAFLIQGSIGWNNERIQSFLGKSENSKVQFNEKHLYPLCFRGVGEGTRQRDSKLLTENQIDKVVEVFFEGNSDYLKRRNLLIFRIAETVGLRRESIASLTIDQFEKINIELAIENGTKFLVVPEKQKFGYQNSFSFPIQLASAISKYCENERVNHLFNLSINENIANNALFLSATTGCPIKKSTITHVIGSAIKLVNDKKGMGPHALRDTFATNWMAQEISFRKRNNLSLSPGDLCQMLATELGHKSITSQAPYISAIRLIGEQDIEKTQARKIVDLQMENDRMKLELLTLKKK